MSASSRIALMLELDASVYLSMDKKSGKVIPPLHLSPSNLMEVWKERFDQMLIIWGNYASFLLMIELIRYQNYKILFDPESSRRTLTAVLFQTSVEYYLGFSLATHSWWQWLSKGLYRVWAGLWPCKTSERKVCDHLYFAHLVRDDHGQWSRMHRIFVWLKNGNLMEALGLWCITTMLAKVWHM